ncbi:hypothetical protein FAVG1_08844 [Fusarium avenaceum]|nr:hypothetical protein FAVG1_08844 [Fusarium avenaceum]
MPGLILTRPAAHTKWRCNKFINLIGRPKCVMVSDMGTDKCSFCGNTRDIGADALNGSEEKIGSLVDIAFGEEVWEYYYPFLASQASHVTQIQTRAG